MGSKIFNVANFIAGTKIKFDRGNAIASLLKSLIIFAAGFKIILPNISNLQLGALTIIIAVGVYIIGWLDLNKIKVYQAELNLNTGKYNPYFVNLKKKRKI